MGGTLQGTPYEAVSDDRLRKVAKRYSGDPAFQRYAKAYVILSEQDVAGDPLACEPLVTNGTAKDVAGAESKVSVCYRWCIEICSYCVKSRWTLCRVSCLLVCFLLRPSISQLFGKISVSVIRLIFRRVLAICSMLLDGFVDEVVYQLDHTVAAALPDPATSQEVPDPSRLVGHLFSGLVGAAITVLLGQRRLPAQP